MRRPRSDGLEARQRLLEAAGAIFAARGFRGARVAEICRRAGANVAAVNYHFGGKEQLYIEVWRHLFHESLRAHPPDGGVPPSAPSAERLRGRILALMRRIRDPQRREFEIVHQEMTNPTGLLAAVMHQTIEPLHRDFSRLVRELLGPAATEERVRLCQKSILAQCFGPLLRERRRRLAPGGPHPPACARPEVDVETLAEHVARFSLAGIREIRRTAGRSPRRRPSGS